VYMRILRRIRQSRATIASAALIAALAAGIGFAPAANASTTGAPSVIHAAGTVTPAETSTHYAGPFKTLQGCLANLELIRHNPQFAGGGCYQAKDSAGNIVYILIYYLQTSTCGGAAAAPTDITAVRVAELASC
jgi:hypothetical protein